MSPVTSAADRPGARVFVSYAHEDYVLAAALREALHSRGVPTAFDRADFRVGEPVLAEVTAGVGTAAALLVLVSVSAAASAWVRAEVAEAARRGIRIVPILVEAEARSLDALGLGDLLAVSVRELGYDEAVRRVVAACRPGGPALGAGRALVIEDTAAVRCALRVVLEGAGFEVETREGFDEAVVAIRAGTYGVLILDMQLDPADREGQQGLVLLQQARVWLPGVPVIVVSALAWSGEQVRDLLRIHGAADYLRKPVDGARLVEVVRAAMDRR